MHSRAHLVVAGSSWMNRRSYASSAAHVLVRSVESGVVRF